MNLIRFRLAIGLCFFIFSIGIAASQDLHDAAESGDIELVRTLLNNDAPVDAVDFLGRSPLQIATYGRHKEVMQELLLQGANVDHQDSTGATSLHHFYNGLESLLDSSFFMTGAYQAMFSEVAILVDKYIDVVQILIDNDINLDEADNDGMSALHMATILNNSTLVKLYLKHGADPALIDNDGAGVMHMASIHGNLEMINIYVKEGIPLFQADSAGANGLLYYCIGIAHTMSNADSTVFQFYESNDFDVNMKTTAGITPLMTLATGGDMEGTKILLSMGADASAVDIENSNALYYAATSGDFPELLNLLAINGASVDSTGGWSDNSPLHEAVMSDYTESVRQLLDLGANVNASDNLGDSPLHDASYHGNLEVYQLLLDHGANVDATNSDYSTPILSAAQNEQFEICLEMLKRSSDLQLHCDVLDVVIDYQEEEIEKMLTDAGCVSDTGSYSYDDTYLISNNLVIASLSGDADLLKAELEAGTDITMSLNWDGERAIHIAAHHGHLKIIELLLEYGAEIDVLDDHGWGALHKAAAAGNEAIVDLLLKNGADANLKVPYSYWNNFDGSTPLSKAILNGHLAIVKKLISAGASLELSVGEFAHSPLHVAASLDTLASWDYELFEAEATSFVKNRTEILKLLVDKELDVNEIDDNGQTPLHLAAATNYSDAAKLLIKNGAEMSIGDSIMGSSPLHIAARNDAGEVVQILLNNGVDPNLVDAYQESPLDDAWYFEYDRVMLILIKNGADLITTSSSYVSGSYFMEWAAEQNLSDLINAVKAREGNGDTETVNVVESNALIDAVRSNDLKLIKSLLKKGENINQQDEFTGYTALHQAVLDDNLEMVKLLIKKGASLDLFADDGSRPLCYAVEYANSSVIQTLIDAGSELNYRNEQNSDRTALHQAVFNSKIGATGQLIDAGADVNPKSSEGWTPLHYAISSANEQLVNTLLDSGADPFTKSDRGWTALHVAAYRSDPTILKVVADQMDNVNVLDGEYDSPLKVAAEYDRLENVEILLSYGADPNVDTSGRSPLYLSIENDNLEMAKLLILEGADVNFHYNQDYSWEENYTPLHFAAAEGHMEFVELLINNGAEINYSGDGEDEGFHSPLTNAIDSENLDIVKYLIEKGADINAGGTGWSDSEGPLNKAAEQGWLEGAQLLLELGAEINSTSGYGDNTPLGNAVCSGNLALVHLLLDSGANINPGGEFQIPLSEAIECMGSDTSYLIIDLLMEHGAQPIRGKSVGESIWWSLAYDNNVDDAAYLLDRGIISLETQEEKSDFLVTSITMGADSILLLLLHRGFDFNSEGNLFKTSILNLIGRYELNDELARSCIELGHDIDKIDALGYNPLLNAIAAGKFSLARLFLESNADIEHKTPEGFTALHLAVEAGNYLLCRSLINMGINVNAESNFGYTALDHANQLYNGSIISLLERNDAVDNDTLSGTWTALSEAVSDNDIGEVHNLIEIGVDINSANPQGYTALHLAVDSVHLEIVRYLCEQGADVNAQVSDTSYRSLDSLGLSIPINQWTPLHFANSKGYSLDIIAVLIEHGANTNLIAHGWHRQVGLIRVSPFHLSLTTRNADLIAMMLNQGNADVQLNVDVGCLISFSPIFFAALDAPFSTIDLMIEKGADIKDISSGMVSGLTPLSAMFLMIEGGYPDSTVYVALSKLIENGADVNMRVTIPFVDIYDETILHYYLKSMQTEMNYNYYTIEPYIQFFEYMLDHGADPKIKNQDGQTPLEYARENDMEEVVIELFQRYQ